MNRGTLLGADLIGLAVGPALKRYRMKKHFQIAITDTTFTYTRDTATINAEAALDGVRTSCGPASPKPTSRPAMSSAPTKTLNKPNERSDR